MMKGIYIAASGMNFQINQLSEVTANLANVNTTGYKRTQLVSNTFGDLVTQFQNPTPFNRVGMGVTDGGRARWESQGPLQRTNNPLHVALSGPGYFQVQDNNGQVVVTRNGDFRLDAQGYMASQEGARVLGQNNQPIQLAAIATETLRIRQDGAIMSGAAEVGRVKVVGPENADPRTFPASNAGVPPIADGFTVEQGYLEGSNVSVINEMVNMITLNKAFTFGQKAITTKDNLLNKTVNDLGRVQ